MANWGELIKKLRLDAGLTQSELARLTGMCQTQISRYETGWHTPGADTLEEILWATGYELAIARIPTTGYCTPVLWEESGDGG